MSERVERQRTRGRGAVFAPRPRPTALELVGLVGVVVGFGSVAGLTGVGIGVGVVAIWYAFSGIYGFAAGQFMLVAVVSPRLTPALVTPELVGLEAALVLVLVGSEYHVATRERRVRRAVWTLATAAVLVGVALGVGVESATVTDERLVVAAVSIVFAAGASLLYLWGRAVTLGDVTDAGPTDARTGHEH